MRGSKSEGKGDGVTALSISVISDEFQDQMAKKVVVATTADKHNEINSMKDDTELVAFHSQQQLVTNDVSPRMINQILGAIVTALTQLGIGMTYGFPGVTLPQLTQLGTEDIYLTPNNAALFSSIVNVGAIFGGLASTPIVARVGLRNTMLLVLPVTLIFWLIMAFSPNTPLLMLSRVGLGIITSAISASSNTYVLEIAHKDWRGILFAVIPTSRQMGFLFVYSLGSSVLSWRQIALVCGTVSTIPPFIGLLFFPESPRWLVTRDREEEAKKSLIFFRGQNYNVQSELNAIIEEVNKSGKNNNMFKQLGQLFQKSTLKTLLMLSFLTVVVSYNGSFAISAYLVPIFEASSSSVDAYTSAILVGVLRVVGTLFYLVLIDRLGRRPLHLLSYLLMSLCNLAFGGYFFVQNTDWATKNLGWLPLTSLLIYTFFVGLGQPVLIMLQGELLSTNVRAIGLCFLSSLLFFGAFIVTQTYYVMTETLGEHGTFWTYSVACMGVLVFSYFTIPETRGRSLEEISKNKKIDNCQRVAS